MPICGRYGLDVHGGEVANQNLLYLFRVADLPCPETAITAFFCNQFIVRSPFSEFAVFEIEYQIGVFDGRKPVGNDKGRSRRSQLFEILLYQRFRDGIHVTRWLIEDEDWVIC